MTERLLSERNLKGLVGKLLKIPIERWSMKDESYTKYPSGPDSMEFEEIIDRISYSTILREFKVTLKRAGDYYLYLTNESEEVSDSTGESGMSSIPGRIEKIFKTIKDKYETHQTQKAREKEQRILAELRRVLQQD